MDQRDKLIDERKSMIDKKLKKAEEKRIQHIEGINRFIFSKKGKTQKWGERIKNGAMEGIFIILFAGKYHSGKEGGRGEIYYFKNIYTPASRYTEEGP